MIYDIYDESGNTVYTVCGKPAWGHKLEIYEHNSSLLALLVVLAIDAVKCSRSKS